MIKIAIIEDEEKSADALKSVLEQYAKEHHLEIKVTLFSDALQFLDRFKADYPLIFLDIEMPYMKGMEAAERIRVADKSCVLVFVTSLAQYAISGYQVGAADYFLKPITYASAHFRLQRVFSMVPQDSPDILIRSSNATVRLKASEILYVESYAHRVIYHAEKGNFEAWDSISRVEEKLPREMFMRCNSGYLVNLHHVTAIEGGCALVGDARLKISDSKKKAFTHALMDSIGGISKTGE